MAEQVSLLLESSDSEWVKSAVYDALSRMGARGANYATLVMETGFSDPDPKDRTAAVKAIAGMREQADIFTQELVKRIDHEDVLVRASAIAALGELGGAEARKHVSKIIAALDDHVWQARLASVEALYALCRTWNGDSGGEEIQWMKATSQRLFDDTWQVRQRAREVLEAAICREKEAVRKTSLVAIMGKNMRDKHGAQEEEEICPSLIAENVVEVLAAEDSWARLAAVDCLGSMGMEAVEYAEPLGRLQHDDASFVRVAVVKALQQMGPDGEFQLVRQNEGLRRLMKLRWKIAIQNMIFELLDHWRKGYFRDFYAAAAAQKEEMQRKAILAAKKRGWDD